MRHATAVLLLFVCIILTWISDALFVCKNTKDTVFLSKSLQRGYAKYTGLDSAIRLILRRALHAGATDTEQADVAPQIHRCR